MAKWEDFSHVVCDVIYPYVDITEHFWIVFPFGIFIGCHIAVINSKQTWHRGSSSLIRCWVSFSKTTSAKFMSDVY